MKNQNEQESYNMTILKLIFTLIHIVSIIINPMCIILLIVLLIHQALAIPELTVTQLILWLFDGYKPLIVVTIFTGIVRILGDTFDIDVEVEREDDV